MERKLASIQVIKDLQPIAGADAILVASVLGWKCVVKKTEFKVGDLCVYFEIDSILPIAEWNAHLRKGSEAHKPLRVRTIRLRGQLSQGLALPVSLTNDETYKAAFDAEGHDIFIGSDITEKINVKKWEPYIPPELHGKVKGTRPSYIPKTDEPRLQSDPEALTEMLRLKADVVGTKKMDGSSITCFFKDTKFGVTSRNMELLETEDNAFWKSVREAKIEEKMAAYFPICVGNYAIQGELCGPGIQGNKMGLDKLTLFWYNVVNINSGNYMDHNILRAFTTRNDLNMVEVVFQGKLPEDTTIDSLLEMANKLDYANGTPAEGIVWRTKEETQSEVLKARMSFKTISNRFLEKYKE